MTPLRPPMLLLLWTVAAALLWWGDLPPRLRRLLALATSGAGLVFLVLALNAAGWREEQTTTALLLGEGYVTGKAMASASLPYYVLTGLCLLLGTLGMALPEPAVRALRRHWLASAVGLSIGVTLVRFLLERAAAPPWLSWAAGIWALAPLVGAYFALSARAEGKGWKDVVRALAVYALAVRGWLALMYTTATLFRLGSTHYDVSRVLRARDPFTHQVHVFQPGSLEQVLALAVLPQLAVWPLYTVAAGVLGAAAVQWITGARRRQEGAKVVRSPEMAPARQD